MELNKAVREELQEVAWLASVVLSLSALGVGVAMALSLVVHGGVFGVV